jgi:hypothetical protein
MRVTTKYQDIKQGTRGYQVIADGKKLGLAEVHSEPDNIRGTHEGEPQETELQDYLVTSQEDRN